MHTTTWKVALHLKGVIITFNIVHMCTVYTVYTVYNLRHAVAIITITFGIFFQNLCIDNSPSKFWHLSSSQ